MIGCIHIFDDLVVINYIDFKFSIYEVDSPRQSATPLINISALSSKYHL